MTARGVGVQTNQGTQTPTRDNGKRPSSAAAPKRFYIRQGKKGGGFLHLGHMSMYHKVQKKTESTVQGQVKGTTY